MDSPAVASPEDQYRKEVGKLHTLFRLGKIDASQRAKRHGALMVRFKQVGKTRLMEINTEFLQSLADL